jgi:DNA-binding CsgD family transcriptional regulator
LKGARRMTTTLSDGDIDLLLRAIGQLTRPGSMRDLRFRTVDAIQMLVPSEHVVWGEIDSAEGYIKALMDPEPDNWPELEAAFAAHLGEHPAIARFLETGDTGAIAVSDLLDADAFHATALYQDFFEPLGVEDQLCMILPVPSLLVGIGIGRAIRGFTTRETQMISQLSVPMGNAYEAAKSYERLQRVLLSISSRYVEPENEGLVLIDRFAHLEFASPNGLAIIDRWFDGKNSDGLPVMIEEWIKHGWNAHRSSSRLEWPISVEHDGRQLVVEQSPGPDGLGACLTLREARDRSTVQPLHSALGLSGREAQILTLVASGMTNDQIGRSLRISSKTVGKHVERILEKLKVPNRTAAAERLHEVERSRSST